MARIPQRCGRQATKLKQQAQHLHQELTKVMRGFGRQCRGQGHVFVKLVRHTEQQLLELGKPITALGQQAQQLLAQATALSDSTRQRLADAFSAAMSRHAHIRTAIHPAHPRQKTPPLVNSSMPMISPLRPSSKARAIVPRNLVASPVSCRTLPRAFSLPIGCPRAIRRMPAMCCPCLTRCKARSTVSARSRGSGSTRWRGTLGINDAALRQALHARGLLTIGIPKTVEPINPTPTPEEIHAILAEAGFHRQRTPYQVQLACACGYSRPVVESHIASLLARGAGQVRYKGLQGAVVQQGMTVMAHNGATLVRIRQQRLSKRAQKFRRLLGLRPRNINQINNPKN